MPFRPCRSSTRLQIFCTAMAVSGVSERRPPQHAVAAHRRDHGVPCPHRDRKIEGADHAHDSQRMPLLVHAMAGTLAVHREPVELARKPDGEIGRCRSSPALRPGLRPESCPFRAKPARRDRRLCSAQLVADFAHDLAAPRSGHHAPVQERFGGARHHGFVIGQACRAESWPAARRWRGCAIPARRRGDWRSSRHSRRRNSPAQCAVFPGFRGWVCWQVCTPIIIASFEVSAAIAPTRAASRVHCRVALESRQRTRIRGRRFEAHGIRLAPRRSRVVTAGECDTRLSQTPDSAPRGRVIQRPTQAMLAIIFLFHDSDTHPYASVGPALRRRPD